MITKPYRLLFLTICFINLISCCSFIKAYAQKQTGYTLLWEITGKGLSKPSYLFGAINVKDHRAHNFSDSLYIALANSSAFAVETHPDSTIKAMINFGYAIPKPAQKTNNEDEPPKMASETYKQTLANSYLYGLARTYQKKMYGLDKLANANQAPETIAIDEEASEEELEEQQDQLENLISIYAKGNLNDIWGELQQYYEEGDFTERNQALTTALIALLSKETIFAAVGVALLPGEDGMIALLKKAGYQLRPVGSSFTTIAANYQIDYTKMDWYRFKDESNYYAVNFPAVPHEYKHEDRAKIWAYIDPATTTLFRATALYTGPIINMTAAQYADTSLNHYIKDAGYAIVKVNHIEKFGSTMLVAELQKEGQYVRTQTIHVNGTFYTFTVIDYANTADKKSIDLFFNSIQINSPTAVNANPWIAYKNEIGAFSIKLPALPDESKKEFPNSVIPESPYTLTFYMATDKVNLMNYIVRYSDYPAGMYLIDKKVVFESLIAEFEQKGQLASEVKVISKDGYDGRAVDIIVANSYLEIEMYLKGNRIYMLLRQNMNGPVKVKKDQYFESFAFLPNLPGKGTALTLGNIEVMMPEKPLLLKKNNEDIADEKTGTSFLANEQSYSVVNKNSGGLYAIEKNAISKYYKTKDLDTLYDLFVKQLGKEKRLLSNNNVTVGKEKAREFITYDSLANTTKKTRIWLQGNNFYMQVLIGTSQEVESEQANIFFNTKVKDTEPLFDFKHSKAQLIVQDLASKDVETQKLAAGALSFYEFERDELPYVYTALQQKYTDDTSSVGIKTKLLHLLEELNDEKTTAFLKKLYQDNKEQDIIQSKILTVLPYTDQGSYDWYLKTLSEAPTFKLKNYWTLFAPLSDSLSFAAANIDQVLKLMEVNEYRPMVLDIFSSMLSTNNITTYKPLLEAKKEAISKYALKDLTTDIAKLKLGDYSITTNDYLIILPKLSLATLTDSYTQKVMTIDSVQSLHTQAIAARITNNLTIAPQVLAAQLDSLSSRYRIMYAFREIGKLNEIPLKYRKHEEFAKLLMHDYLVDEYDFPSSINLLGAIKEGELTYYAFDFSYTEDGVQKTYVGVCGPFNSKKQELDFESYYSLSNFDIKTKDWLKTAKALIHEME